MKRLLAYFFIIIFSTQALPIKAIGKILAKNQLTEEVKNDCDDDADDIDDDGTEFLPDLYLEHNAFSFSESPAITGHVSPVMHAEDRLPNSHVLDIVCPPPNC